MSSEKPVSAILVEDEEIIRQMLKQALVVLGCDVLGEANNGIAAAELFNETKPDLVLMDIRMPRSDGIEALSKIKEIEPDAYVVMMTSINDEEIIEDCIIAGAKDYIRKDVPIDQVVSRLERHIRRVSEKA